MQGGGTRSDATVDRAGVAPGALVDESGSAPSSASGSVWSDGLSIGVILLVILGISVHHYVFDDWLSSKDRVSFFLPMYGYLGDRLSALDVPAWNPYVQSGAPFAGDPESGWMYFPAMLTFTLLNPIMAYKAMMTVQLLVAALSIYPLARLLRLFPVPALVTTVSYTFGTFTFQHTGGSTIATHVSTWLPLAFLGVELALRAGTWPRWTVASFMAGLAISQMLAGWPGQGSAYTLLMVGGWVAYRGLLDPFRKGVGWTRRGLNTVVTGVAALGTGLAISAAALLPRLAVNAESNNPGGTYEGVPGTVPGAPYPLWRLIRNILSNDISFRTVSISGVMLALAIFAVLVARRRHCAPFFIGLMAVVLLLSVRSTIVHRLIYTLVPTFEELHVHDPKRIFWIAPLGMAVLAGIGLQHLDRLGARRRPWLWCWFPLLTISVLDLLPRAVDQWLGWETFLSVALVCALAQLAVAPPGPLARHLSRDRLAPLAMGAIVVLSLWFPMGWDIARTRILPLGDPGAIRPWNSTSEAQTGVAQTVSRTDPGGAGEFLQRQRENSPPFRYTSYAGYDLPGNDDKTYRFTRFRPQILGQLENGRPMRLGLETTNGYNPMQMQNYAEYVTVMNGRVQNYHFTNVMLAGLDSPLFDMLNVRYIIVDARIPPDRDDYQAIASRHTEVFRNQYVIVFENMRAYPRAWIVRSVRDNDDGAGLALLNSGALDGRTTAVIDDGQAPIRQPGIVRGQPPRRTPEGTATVLAQAPESMTIRAETATDGLLVISEIFEEGWVATVDGEPADVIRTNHVLRGVSLTAGQHTVELRYEPRPLRIGLWISGTALTGMAGAVGWLAWSERQLRRRRSRNRRGRLRRMTRPVGAGSI